MLLPQAKPISDFAYAARHRRLERIATSWDLTGPAPARPTPLRAKQDGVQPAGELGSHLEAVEKSAGSPW